MFPRRIVMLVVIGLIFFGLISLGNNTGYTQGYQMGYIAAGGEPGAIVNTMPGGYGFFSPFAFVFGLFFKIGFFFLMLMIAGKAFHFFRWRMAGESYNRHWHNQKWETHKAKWAEWRNQQKSHEAPWQTDSQSETVERTRNKQDDVDRSQMI